MFLCSKISWIIINIFKIQYPFFNKDTKECFCNWKSMLNYTSLEITLDLMFPKNAIKYNKIHLENSDVTVNKEKHLYNERWIIRNKKTKFFLWSSLQKFQAAKFEFTSGLNEICIMLQLMSKKHKQRLLELFKEFQNLHQV